MKFSAFSTKATGIYAVELRIGNYSLIAYSGKNMQRWAHYNKDGIILESRYERFRKQKPFFPPYEEMSKCLKAFLVKELL